MNRPTASPPVLDESIIRQFDLATSDLVARWTERAKACSIKVHPCTPDAIMPTLDGILAPYAITRCILNAHEFETSLQLPAYLAQKQIQVIAWGAPNCRADAFTCEAAITDCRAGLADSGGIMVWSDAGFGRSSTLVIPIHVVLLRTSRILPDLVDALRLVQSSGPLPSNVVVINGPSKTADIEMNLITGVHGPKFLHIILIDDLTANR